MTGGPTDRKTWLVRDVFYILFLYFIVLIFFLFIITKVFGKGALEDTNLNLGILILEEFFDALVLTLLPILFVIKLYECSLKEIGVSFRNFWKNLFGGLVFGGLFWVGVSICDMVIRVFFGELPIHPYIEKLEMSDSILIHSMLLTSIIVLGPISEEIFFRGFARTVLKKRYGRSAGIILSSFLFAGLHFNLYWGIQIFLIGIGLALLVESTGSIVSVVAAHSSINMLSVFVGRL